MKRLTPEQRALHDALVKRFIDNGKIVEAGFTSMRLSCLPADASPEQVTLLRVAFMAGAQHLFASIMSVMDSDSEPTANDMRRMSLISNELEAFAKEMALFVAPAGTRQ